jgi:hypothetical protein
MNEIVILYINYYTSTPAWGSWSFCYPPYYQETNIKYSLLRLDIKSYNLIPISLSIKVLHKDKVSRPSILHKKSLSNTLQSKNLNQMVTNALPHEILQFW